MSLALTRRVASRAATFWPLQGSPVDSAVSAALFVLSLSRLLPPTLQPLPLSASPCPPHLLTGLPLRTAWHFHEAAGSRGQHRICGISRPWVQILAPALISCFFPFNISNLDKFFNLSKLSLPHLKSEMLPLGPQDYPGVCQGKLLVKNQKKKKRLSRVFSVRCSASRWQLPHLAIPGPPGRPYFLTLLPAQVPSLPVW